MGLITIDNIVRHYFNDTLKAPVHVNERNRHKYVYLSMYYSHNKGIDKYGVANNESVFSENDYHTQIHTSTTSIVNYYSITDNLFAWIEMLEFISHVASIRYNLYHNFITVAISDSDYIPIEQSKLNYDFNTYEQIIKTNNNVIMFKSLNDLRLNYKNILHHHEEHIMFNKNGFVCVNEREHDKKRRLILSLLLNISYIISNKFNLNYSSVKYNVNKLDNSLQGLLLVNTRQYNQQNTYNTTLTTGKNTRLVSSIETIDNNQQMKSLISEQYKYKVNEVFNDVLTNIITYLEYIDNINKLYKLILSSLLEIPLNLIDDVIPEKLFTHEKTTV